VNPILSVRGIRKVYGARAILSNIDLDLPVAQVTVVSGGNGVGKTTLLRILAGLERPDAGSVALDGEPVDLKRYPRRLRDSLGFVHQDPVLFSTSIEANIGYGWAWRRLGTTEIRTRVEAALCWAGLDTLRHTRPKDLSGGERQRVALARAKVLEPRILLLDEPTAHLDDAARYQVLELMAQFAATQRSVLAVGHDRDLLDLPGAVHLVLKDGRIGTVNR